MDQIIPNPDALQIHWLWFQALLLVTFVLHLILMNLMLGGSLIALWENIVKRRNTEYAGSLPILVALTINLGVPPLLFVQVLYGHLFYSSSVMMAVPWIMVIPALILAYFGSYVFVRNLKKAPVLSRTGLIVSSLFILYVGFMYVNNSTLTLNPEVMKTQLLNPGGMNLNTGDGSLWPRYLHFLVSALAVASLGIAVYAHFFGADNPGLKEKRIKVNLKRFACFTLSQFVFGTLFWISAPKHVWLTFMGKNIWATALMILSILIIASMIVSAFRGRLWPSVIHAVLVIIIMAIMREFMRLAYLDQIFSPSQMEVSHRYSPFIVFLIVFITGIYMLYYMIRLAIDKKELS